MRMYVSTARPPAKPSPPETANQYEALSPLLTHQTVDRSNTSLSLSNSTAWQHGNMHKFFTHQTRSCDLRPKLYLLVSFTGPIYHHSSSTASVSAATQYEALYFLQGWMLQCQDVQLQRIWQQKDRELGSLAALDLNQDKNISYSAPAADTGAFFALLSPVFSDVSQGEYNLLLI